MNEYENQLTHEEIQKLAEHLENAELQKLEVTKITDDYPHMTWQDAYDIQWAIRARKRANNHKIIGMKMGLTSAAKMQQMGVDSPTYGFLADYFAIESGADIEIDALIHPKIESEIAFVTHTDLKGPNVDVADVLAATEYVVPAVEIIDSRYKDFKFDLKSVVADHSSSVRFIRGKQKIALDKIDLKTLEVILSINDTEIERGTGAAVMGDPAISVAKLANMLAERNEILPAGSFVMTGGMTAAASVAKGDRMSVVYQGVETVTAQFV
ncbi:MAG: 2-oxo-3-hexenedioate decarboxylase [Alphaproteobacteria bacterium]|nr:2-oxo-3-hexenedioate decarboxylase [Alphaproteobacteria bacterium]